MSKEKVASNLKNGISWQTKFNNTSKRSYTMTKLVSPQGCRDGSTYATH
jgi:hypothetical protein